MKTEEAASSPVKDNPEQQRYEMGTSAGIAVAEYRRDGGTLTIFQTEVPSALRGQGMGDKLVRGVLEDVRQRNLKIVPRCWFVRAFVDANPEYRDLLA